MADLARIISFDAESWDISERTVDLDKEREELARHVAAQAQESIPEAYRDPHTRQVALEAARIAIQQMRTRPYLSSTRHRGEQ